MVDLMRSVDRYRHVRHKLEGEAEKELAPLEEARTLAGVGGGGGALKQAKVQEMALALALETEDSNVNGREKVVGHALGREREVSQSCFEPIVADRTHHLLSQA